MRGSYLLLLELKKDKIIPIGKVGEIGFHDGLYVYVGSALNGLEQRIERHLRKNKKIHWHIDYLLKHAKIIDVFYKESKTHEECITAKTLGEKLLSIPDFGCSDCTCNSHLFHGSYEKIINTIENLEMKQYMMNAKS